MRHKKAAIGAVLLLVVSAVLGATVLREPIAIAASPFTNVIVANTNDNPVPTRQTGTANVAVVDDREPFEKRIDGNAGSGDFTARAFFTVPADKRLVVEFISVFVYLPKGQVPLVGVNADSGAQGFVMPMQLEGTQASSAGTNDIYASAMKVLDFAEPGEFYDVFMARNDSTANVIPQGDATLTVYLSGYLEDA